MADINNNKINEIEEIKALVENMFKQKSEDETKNIIRRIFPDLPLNGWSYTINGTLAMIHIDTDVIEELNVRNYNGAIVELMNGSVICPGKYIPTVVTDSISSNVHLDEHQGENLHLTDTEGNEHILPLSEIKILESVNGVCLRVFWHDGKMHVVTYKRFDATGKWNGASFLEVYNRANGPQAEELFDTTKAYSSMVYVFNVHDPAWCVGSRQDVKVPSITLLDVIVMNKCPLGIKNFDILDEVLPVLDKTFDIPTVYRSCPINIAEADAFLEHGFYLNDDKMFDDNRNKHGEAVLVNMNGLTIIVKSKAFAWREKMRGGNPNIYFAFMDLLKIAQTAKNLDQLKEQFIMFPAWPESCFRALFDGRDKKLTCFPTNEWAKCELFESEGIDTALNFEDLDARYRLVWMNYVLSIPFCYQEEAMNYLDNFYQSRREVCNWLYNMHRRFLENRGVKTLSEHINDEKYKMIFNKSHKRILFIIELVRMRKIKESDQCKKNHLEFKEEDFVRKNIEDAVNKEYCDSLHRIVRAMRQYNSIQ